eukprot:15341508-Ditylum_brightwellii.AAC.1
MKSQPLSIVPEVESLANDLAVQYDLPNKVWDVGVNMVDYRYSHHSIGWHADDAQGESIMLCVVVDSGEDMCPIK